MIDETHRLRSYDVDLPLEVDDEYWVNPDPELAFTQPPGKPSNVTFFNYILRLGRIHSLTIRSMVILWKVMPYILGLSVSEGRIYRAW